MYSIGRGPLGPFFLWRGRDKVISSCAGLSGLISLLYVCMDRGEGGKKTRISMTVVAGRYLYYF